MSTSEASLEKLIIGNMVDLLPGIVEVVKQKVDKF